MMGITKLSDVSTLNTLLNFSDDWIIHNGFITDVVIRTGMRAPYFYRILVYVPQNIWKTNIKINRIDRPLRIWIYDGFDIKKYMCSAGKA